MRILVIEDEKKVAEFVARGLRDQPFRRGCFQRRPKPAGKWPRPAITT